MYPLGPCPKPTTPAIPIVLLPNASDQPVAPTEYSVYFPHYTFSKLKNRQLRHDGESEPLTPNQAASQQLFEHVQVRGVLAPGLP